jgi:hypothetical protein
VSQDTNARDALNAERSRDRWERRSTRFGSRDNAGDAQLWVADDVPSVSSKSMLIGLRVCLQCLHVEFTNAMA